MWQAIFIALKGKVDHKFGTCSVNYALNIKTFHPSCCLKENELERMCLKKEIARIKTRLVLKAFKIPLYFSNHAISPKTII